jgi:hypothetical protein
MAKGKKKSSVKVVKSATKLSLTAASTLPMRTVAPDPRTVALDPRRARCHRSSVIEESPRAHRSSPTALVPFHRELSIVDAVAVKNGGQPHKTMVSQQVNAQRLAAAAAAAEVKARDKPFKGRAEAEAEATAADDRARKPIAAAKAMKETPSSVHYLTN